MLRIQPVRVADHGEQAFVLRRAINHEISIEYFVAAMLAVGLRKHHQLNIGRVAFEPGKSINQVIHFVVSQRQTKFAVCRHQRRTAARQNIHLFHRNGDFFVKQLMRCGSFKHHTFGHTVVQQVGQLLQLARRNGYFAQQGCLQGQAVFNQPLNAIDVQAAVAGNVGRFGGPRRHRAEPGRDHNRRSRGRGILGGERFAIGQQFAQPGLAWRFQRLIRPNQVDKPRADLPNARENRLQARQKLRESKLAQRTSPLER